MGVVSGEQLERANEREISYRYFGSCQLNPSIQTSKNSYCCTGVSETARLYDMRFALEWRRRGNNCLVQT